MLTVTISRLLQQRRQKLEQVHRAGIPLLQVLEDLPKSILSQSASIGSEHDTLTHTRKQFLLYGLAGSFAKLCCLQVQSDLVRAIAMSILTKEQESSRRCVLQSIQAELGG